MNDNEFGIDFSDLDLDWLDHPGRTRAESPADHGSAARGDTSSQNPDKAAPVLSPDFSDIVKAEAPEKNDPSPQTYEKERPSVRRSAVSGPTSPRPVSSRSADTEADATRASAPRQKPSRRTDPDRSSASVRSSVRSPAPPPDERHDKRRRRRRGGSGRLLIVLIVVLVLGMIFAGWQLSSIFRNYKRDRSAYEDLAAHAIVAIAEQEEETEAQPETADESAGRIVSEIPFSVDWKYLRSINSDIVGWLYCPDTVINYPVVQTTDLSFYLTHGFDSESNTSGTLFADPSSVTGILQSNYIIYGHNMKDGSMFGTFKNYVDRSYFDEHPVLYYLTPAGSYRIDLLCAHVAESLVDNLPGYFSSISDYRSYLNTITGNAFWVNYDVVTTDLQLFSMSTCTSAAGFDDARLILFGVMVPIQ